MKTISVCMIVRDEELVLKRVLSQVCKFADEIIIVDTGSVDMSKEIAHSFTDLVFDFEWCDDFSLARNFSFSKASMDYIVWLDADDYICDDSIKRLIDLKNMLDNEDTIFLPYQIAFNESGKCTFEYLRERIVRNLPNFVWQGCVHEVLVPYGNVATFNIPIQHRKEKQGESERNLKIYRKMKERGVKFSAREQFYFANELYYNNYLYEAIENYKIFLSYESAFIENKIQALINLCKIYARINDNESAKRCIFESFMFDLPRSEALYELANIYFNEKEYIKAIYYYKLAIQKPNLNTFAFIDINCYDYLPNLQIALCYYYLQDFKSACKYNKRALRANKKSEIAKSNQKFYEMALNESKSER
ncbi:MAG: glycosyltransferase [Christensenellales bacterium]